MAGSEQSSISGVRFSYPEGACIICSVEGTHCWGEMFSLAMLGTSPFGTEEGWRKKRQKLHLAIVKGKGEILNLAKSKRRSHSGARTKSLSVEFLNTEERIFAWQVCTAINFGSCFTKCALWIIFSIVLLKGRLVSVFFAKFNEVSSEAGNLRILLEAPWNLLREKGGQISMRFVCVAGRGVGGVALVLNGYSDIYRKDRLWSSMGP